MQDEAAAPEGTTRTRHFWIAAAIVAAWAAALALYHVHGEVRRGWLLGGGWALGLVAIGWWSFARAGSRGRSSFVAIASSLLAVGLIGIVAGMLAASTAYAGWRAAADASVERLDSADERERGRRIVAEEASYPRFLLETVAPRAKWPALAILPIAIVVAVTGARESREPEIET